MTLLKALDKMFMFVSINSDRLIDSDEDQQAITQEFRNYLKSEKNFHEVNYKITLAEKLGFIEFDSDAKTLEDYVQPTDKYTQYLLEHENNLIKFIYGLIGSSVTIIGGLIGALITALF